MDPSSDAPTALPPITAAEQAAHHRLGARLAGLEIAEFVRPTEHHVVVDGLRLHALDWGRAGRPPIVFLHGGGQTARTWDLVCLALRDQHRCVAIDQRGHGDSEWSPDLEYRPASHARDVAGVLDALGIERCTLVGMSMGCLNGLELTLSRSERVAAFVAVDAGPWVNVAGAKPIIDFTREGDAAADLDELIGRALRFNPRRDPRLLAMSLRHNLRRRPDGRLTWKTDRRRPLDLSEMSARLEDLQARAARIACPVLILRGAESEVFLDAHAERFARALPDARWMRIEGAGHTIQGDAPAVLVQAVRDFLAAR